MNSYLVTVEIIPTLPINLDPFIETVEITSPSANLYDIEDRLGGFTNSPVHNFMKQYDIDIVDNFHAIRIEDVQKPNTSKRNATEFSGRIKRYSEIYGYWITHEGELIPVTDVCGHVRIHMDGYKDGWIAVITHCEDSLSFRFFDEYVSISALKVLLDIIRKSNYPIYHCDFGLNEGIFDKNYPSKIEVNKRIKNLINKLNQKD